MDPTSGPKILEPLNRTTTIIIILLERCRKIFQRVDRKKLPDKTHLRFICKNFSHKRIQKDKSHRRTKAPSLFETKRLSCPPRGVFLEHTWTFPITILSWDHLGNFPEICPKSNRDFPPTKATKRARLFFFFNPITMIGVAADEKKAYWIFIAHEEILMNHQGGKNPLNKAAAEESFYW